MSRKQRPDTKQLGEMLAEPLFRRQQGSQPASTEPLTPTPIRVPVAEIQPYDRNPRQTPNPVYEEIKDSIRVNGMQQVLTVSKRGSDDACYMVSAGGNTCLQAVQEIYGETGDERFAEIWCQYEPWRDDASTLLAHIRENDLRSDLIFIDRALAIRELRHLLEDEAGSELSQRGLRDALAERGYHVGRTTIGWYDYVVDRIYPVIPTPLQDGLGRDPVRRIYELERAFFRAWKHLGLTSETQADEIFQYTLGRHDDEDFGVEGVRADLEEELSDSADCPVARARFALGDGLGGAGGIPDEGAGPAWDREDDNQGSSEGGDADEGRGAAGEGGTPPPAPPKPKEQRGATTGADTGDKRRDTPPPGSNESEDVGQQSAPGTPAREGSRSGGAEKPPLDDLKSLRSRCWTLASRLARGTRLGDVIQPIPAGSGYLVAPLPADAQEAMHPEVLRTAGCVWWQLASIAEQFARHGHALEYMPSDWHTRPIGQAMRVAASADRSFTRWQWHEADIQIFTELPSLEGPDLAPNLYAIFTDTQWGDWVALVETYRLIHSHTHDHPWRET